MTAKPSFSRRRNGSPWIQRDFPETARTALRHLLYDIVDHNYVDGWIGLDKELRRIAREAPTTYDENKVASVKAARASATDILSALSWEKIFDFCERLWSHLPLDVKEWNGFANDYDIIEARENVQNYISDELDRIFIEENLAYTFKDGQVVQRARGHTLKQITKAESSLGNPKLNRARSHYRKSLAYFESPTSPDYENAVKEAVCAVEAAARALFPELKAKTLGEFAKRIQGKQDGKLPKTLADTITGLYGFRNTGEGVSHGGSEGGQVTRYIAEYVISVAAAQIILLDEVASSDEHVPF